MVKFNVPKTYVFSFVCAVLFSTGYMLLYINGVFGEPLVGMELLSGFLASLFHPLNLVTTGIILFVGYRHFRERYIVQYHNMRNFVIYYLLFIGVLTVVLIGFYMVEKTFIDFLVVFYVFFIGLGIGLYFGMKIFEIKDDVKNPVNTPN